MTSVLQVRIQECLKKREILLMSHAVLGYPSVDENIETINAFANAGVEMIELQFPFSEPIADGPTLMHANQVALQNGITVSQCFKEAKKITTAHKNVIFVIMTYYNLIFHMGDRAFVKQAADSGILGIIVPDLPPEEAGDFLEACEEFGVSPIFLFTPKTTTARMAYIAERARGMIYCVARAGVSGYSTLFSHEFDLYIKRAREASSLPIGVGFGVQSREDVESLKGKADIAIVCSQAVRIAVEKGPKDAAAFLQQLR